jgi:small GTP-binding protein
MENNQFSEMKNNESRKKASFNKIPNKDTPSERSSNVLAEEEIDLKNIDQNLKFNKNEFQFKILFLGDTKVGKTSLISMICDGYVNNTYTKTLCCDVRKKVFKIGQTTTEIKFFDIGDVDLEFNLSSILEYLSIVHCCIYVVDSTRPSSLDKIEKILKNLKNHNMINVLALNKIDLVESVSQANRKNMLSIKSQKIIEFDRNFNTNEFKLFSKIVQTSVKNNQTVQDLFNSVLNSLIDYYSEEKNFEFYLKKCDSEENKIFFKYKMRKNMKNRVCC